ncbi:Selenocysteine insertion sequence-binding protein 2 [Microtus ochrogaster]|uniref:Selenocysteine insertion sequence-binding protein 2 n=1 Tax=Microtus ochrogaster TaxID=79684 RepID=A0A8J6KTX8_MICOH|nr:Selenocysteine insertion sequence-binding protein 2 [Microtus ochrogaster]
MAHKQIYYSDKYFDEHYEYRPGRRKRRVVGWPRRSVHGAGYSVAAMASERPREPEGEDSIKLSADVKPFVPKFAGLNVAWSESSEACVFPGCAATYYPFVQESPATEQKVYPEDMAFRAPAFPAQYVSSELSLHPFARSTYALESAQSACSVPALQCDYSQAQCHPGFRTAKPRNEHMCPPQDAKGVLKKKYSDERRTCDAQKSNSRRADGTVPSEMRPARGSCHLSARAEGSLKSDGCHKRTDRKSRVLEKTTSTSKPEFEFSRLDFPELQSPKNSNMPETQKQPRWGPLGSAASNTPLLGKVGKPAAAKVEGEMVKTNPTDGAVADNAASSSPCTRGSAAATGNIASLISLKKTASSADAKHVSVTSEALSDPSYSREKCVHPTAEAKASQGGELEQNETSRKNKKKKDKSKSNYEVLAVQEPPRIEDAEEFPNLSAASERRHRVESLKLQSKQQAQNDFKTGGKKSQIPVQLDLGGMLAALEKQQHAPHAKPSSRPVVFSVGAVPVLSKDASSGERGRRSSQVKTPHNPLDSSAPLMKKGKQREIPKAKKPTSLKKIILKERQERLQQRLQESAVSLAVASDDAQKVENGASDQAAKQLHPAGSEKTEESVSSTPVIEGESEEPTATEIQRDPEVCQPAPGSATFPKIHSRRFRDYCSQMLSKEVDACVTGLLKELVRFQDRMYQKDPVKAKTKRRLVLGLREVLKHLKLRKLKCIIISPNCEKTQSKGGLDDTLHTIIDCACEQNIPFVFALNRKALGRSLNKAVPVSIVGIFSYDGAQDQFHKMVELTMAARQAYKTMLETVRQELAGQPGPQTPPNPPIQDPIQSTDEGALASTGKEPYYTLHGRDSTTLVTPTLLSCNVLSCAQDQFHKMVELTMAARQAYKTMLETVRQELAGQPGPQTPPNPPIQDPIQSTDEGALASTGKEPYYIEIWRKHLEAYSQRALELEDSLEASTSQMMNLNL